MKNINVTKTGLLPDKEFSSMLKQLKAEYPKAVPKKKFIVALLEKTRNNRNNNYHLLGMKIYT